MKIPAFFLCIALTLHVCAQKLPFVRVFDLSGKKIAKGRIYDATDSSLLLGKSSAKLNTISLGQIGTIKTKHSGGNNVLVGSVIGVTTFAIVGAAVAEPDKELGFARGETALAGALIGAPAGAAIGALTILFKRSATFIVNADPEKWKEVQRTLLALKK